MKKVLLTLLVLLILVSLSCSLGQDAVLSTGAPKNSGPTQPAAKDAYDFTRPANPINVTAALDSKKAATASMTRDGGKLALTDAQGNQFLLEIPAGALDTKADITMTALQSLSGAPLSGGMKAAVQLEPSGLVLNKAAVLTITPKKDIPIKEQLIFGYEAGGQDYHLAMVDHKSKDIRIFLLGFSGAGAGSASDADFAAMLNSQANDASIRLQNEMGQVTQQARRESLQGISEHQEGDKVMAPEEWFGQRGADFLDSFYRQVVLKERTAANKDCRYAVKALSDSMTTLRAAALLGMDKDSAGNGKYGGDSLGDIMDKYGKMAQECKNGYKVDQKAGDAHIFGTFCHSIDYPFVLAWSMPGVNDGTIRFLPSSDKAGGFMLKGSYQAVVVFNDTGDYTVQKSDKNEPLTITMKGQGTTSVPVAGVTKNVALQNTVLNLQNLTGTCSEQQP